MFFVLNLVLFISAVSGDCTTQAHSGGLNNWYEVKIPGFTSWTQMPCAYGTVYNPYVCEEEDGLPCDTPENIAAKDDADDDDSDDDDDEPECLYRAKAGNSSLFEQYDEGWDKWVEMPCPFGTVFNPLVCTDNETACTVDGSAGETEDSDDDDTDEAPDCIYRANSGGNSSFYDKWVLGSWQEMPCALGTTYNPFVCDEDEDYSLPCDSPYNIEVNTAIAALMSDEDEPCDSEPWIKFERKGICYAAIKYPMTKADAMAACAKVGASMATRATAKLFKKTKPDIAEVWSYHKKRCYATAVGDGKAKKVKKNCATGESFVLCQRDDESD